MKKILVYILIIALLLSLSACSKNKNEWVFNQETALELLEEYKKISEIPRQSGSCSSIANYIKSSLSELGIDAKYDENGNLIADIPASEGLEKLPLTALQSNMDMICSPQPTEGGFVYKLEGSQLVLSENPDDVSGYDPLTDGIELIYNDGGLRANGTALGADSGLGISLILKYLSDGNPHGPLRLIFTVDANDGFYGATKLDKKYLEDLKYLINLCSRSSSVVVNSSAGEYDILAQRDEIKTKESKLDKAVAIRVSGLIGGNAADDLKSGRLNAVLVLIDMLQSVRDAGIDFDLSNIYGGSYPSEIITDATAIIRVDTDKLSTVWKHVTAEIDGYADKYSASDPGLKCSISDDNSDNIVLDDSELDNLLAYPKKCEDGILTESGLVNLGSFDYSTEIFRVHKAVISSDAAELQTLSQSQTEQLSDLQLVCEESKVSECWVPNKSSSLSKQIASKYKEITSKEMPTVSKSRGLECGSLASKNDSLEIVSIGPDVWDCGTVEEFCNMESAVKILNLLEGVLPEIN